MLRVRLSLLVGLALFPLSAFATPPMGIAPRPWGPVANLRPGMTVAEATRIAPSLLGDRLPSTISRLKYRAGLRPRPRGASRIVAHQCGA